MLLFLVISGAAEGSAKLLGEVYSLGRLKQVFHAEQAELVLKMPLFHDQFLQNGFLYWDSQEITQMIWP